MNNMKQHQPLKHDKYLKAVADASNVLNIHKLDNLGRNSSEKIARTPIRVKEKTILSYLSYSLLN
jgi:hypothetical protein